jgi:ribose 5-phosphate isomerase B
VRVALTADHNGVAVKERLAAWLAAHGHEVDDRAAHVGEEIVDYPPLCEDVCRQVVGGAAERGIVVGGSGAGEAVACNKIRGIRAGLCSDPFTTEISRANNDSNVLVLGAKVVSPELADELVDIWLRTGFRGGVHQKRIDMIAALERGESLL